MHVVVGRDPACEIVLADPSVSARHARLFWEGTQLVIEDLASANGVSVNGVRIQRIAVRVGDDVRLGAVPLPWSDPRLRPLLRRGAGATQVLRAQPARRGGAWLGWLSGLVACAGAGAGIWLARREASPPDAPDAPTLPSLPPFLPARDDPEARVARDLAPRIARALEGVDPTVRDLAVRVAAQKQGTFRVEQVAAIWTHVRSRWKYVNDPRGTEYVARPAETLAAGYAGDCDDYAVLLAAMVGAIGGRTRVVVMNGPRGGHAYTETCIEEPAAAVATKLAREYARKWTRYTNGRSPTIQYRHDDTCPVWLSLDWNATVPGGGYEPENWAVAVSPDGHTETLTPAAAVDAGAPPARAAQAPSH